MRTEFAPYDPGSIVFEAKVRMSLQEWRELQNELDHGMSSIFGQAARLSQMISAMVREARQYWTQEVKNGNLPIRGQGGPG